MKIAIAVCAVLLSGCAYNMTLYPRGGGELAQGVADPKTRSLEVTIKGVKYEGTLNRGTSAGFMIGAGGAIRPGIGFSNAFSSVATNGNKAVRCELSLSGAGGDGVCMDGDNVTYDVIVKM